MGDGFYRSKDPTNSIKVLKENLQRKTSFSRKWEPWETAMCARRPDRVCSPLLWTSWLQSRGALCWQLLRTAALWRGQHIYSECREDKVGLKRCIAVNWKYDWSIRTTNILAFLVSYKAAGRVTAEFDAPPDTNYVISEAVFTATHLTHECVVS